MKKVAIVLVVILLIIALGLAVVAMRAGALVKNAVEEFGPQITGTSVSLEGVGLSVWRGYASLDGLLVGNPEGFQAPNLLQVGKLELELDVASLFGDPIRVRRILVEGAQMTYEAGPAGLNLRTLQRNIQQRTQAMISASAAEQAEEGPARNIVIGDVLIRGTEVRLLAGVGELSRERSFVLPDIHLQNIGEESGTTPVAAAIAQLSAAVTREIIEQVSKAMASGEVQELRERLEGGLEEGRSELENRLRNALPR